MFVKTDLQNITAFRLELLADQSLPLGGPGRSLKGLAALTEIVAEAAPADAPTKVTKLKFAKSHRRFRSAGMPLDPTFETKPASSGQPGQWNSR